MLLFGNCVSSFCGITEIYELYFVKEIQTLYLGEYFLPTEFVRKDLVR